MASALTFCWNYWSDSVLGCVNKLIAGARLSWMYHRYSSRCVMEHHCSDVTQAMFTGTGLLHAVCTGVMH